MKFFEFKSIDSTNEEAKRKITGGEQLPFAVISDMQTSGRGRLGRSFYSPKNTGLYFSLALPVSKITDTVTLTVKAAAATASAIEKFSGKKVGIKWVNDIFLDGKKICGILTQTVTENNQINSVVVGIGINLTTEVFPDDLKAIAGSLGIRLPTEKFIEKIYTDLINENYEWYDYYLSHSTVIGKEISFTENGKTDYAVATDINKSGGLIVKLNCGSFKTLSTGEITVR